MKTILYYTLIAFIIFQFFHLFHLLNQRDEANAKYWTERQAQCRSLGFDWDLNNKGKCVQFIPEI